MPLEQWDERPIAIYAELLGKSIIYSLGGDYSFNPWIAVGAHVSALPCDNSMPFTVGGYVNFYPLRGRLNAMLLQAGGMYSSLLASSCSGFIKDDGPMAHAAFGWEYRGTFLFRVVADLIVFHNSQGIQAVPWVGFTLGGTLALSREQ